MDKQQQFLSLSLTLTHTHTHTHIYIYINVAFKNLFEEFGEMVYVVDKPFV